MTDDEVFRTTNENIEHATPEALQELAELVVARAVTRDRALASVEWTPPGAPFFAEQAASFWRPRRALEPLYRRDDALAWYVA